MRNKDRTSTRQTMHMNTRSLRSDYNQSTQEG